MTQSGDRPRHWSSIDQSTRDATWRCSASRRIRHRCHRDRRRARHRPYVHALERYSTWSWASRVDLADYVAVVDHGDVVEPDGEGSRERLAAMLEGVDAPLTIFLGGDNAATWHAMGAFTGERLSEFGLITLDAHLDMRDGRSNGSPVRQLLEEGLDPRHVVQVGTRGVLELRGLRPRVDGARRAHHRA